MDEFSEILQMAVVFEMLSRPTPPPQGDFHKIHTFWQGKGSHHLKKKLNFVNKINQMVTSPVPFL